LNEIDEIEAIKVSHHL